MTPYGAGFVFEPGRSNLPQAPYTSPISPIVHICLKVQGFVRRSPNAIPAALFIVPIVITAAGLALALRRGGAQPEPTPVESSSRVAAPLTDHVDSGPTAAGGLESAGDSRVEEDEASIDGSSIESIPGLQVESIPEVQRVHSERLTGTEFRKHIRNDVRKIGSVSFGFANRGFLWNGVQMRDDPAWTVVDSARAWGTLETVSSIGYAIRHVRARFEDTHPLHVGHIGRRFGGELRPHKSHQSGRDADIGFYYSKQPKWYRLADKHNFDVERNWALIEALTRTTKIEYIFVDRTLIALLRKQSEERGLTSERLKELYGHDRVQGVIRHAKGHRTHFHVRFASPDAVRAANFLRGYYGNRARRSAFVLKQLRALAKRAEVREQRLALRKKRAAVRANR